MKASVSIVWDDETTVRIDTDTVKISDLGRLLAICGADAVYRPNECLSDMANGFAAELWMHERDDRTLLCYETLSSISQEMFHRDNQCDSDDETESLLEKLRQHLGALKGKRKVKEEDAKQESTT